MTLQNWHHCKEYKQREMWLVLLPCSQLLICWNLVRLLQSSVLKQWLWFRPKRESSRATTEEIQKTYWSESHWRQKVFVQKEQACIGTWLEVCDLDWSLSVCLTCTDVRLDFRETRFKTWKDTTMRSNYCLSEVPFRSSLIFWKCIYLSWVQLSFPLFRLDL